MLFPSYSEIAPSCLEELLHQVLQSYFARNGKADFFAALGSAQSLHTVESFCWWGHIFRDSASCIEVSCAFWEGSPIPRDKYLQMGGRWPWASIQVPTKSISAPLLVLFIKNTKVFHIYFSDISLQKCIQVKTSQAPESWEHCCIGTLSKTW